MCHKKNGKNLEFIIFPPIFAATNSFFRSHTNLRTMDQPEEQLIARLKAGEDAAYRQLYSEHYDVLCRVAFRYVQDVVVAEIVVEDTIVHLWEVRQTVEVKVSLRSYLLAAVRNRCLNYLAEVEQQRERVFSTLAPDELSSLREQLDTGSPMGEEELVALVRQAVEHLPAESRRVFMMSRVEELTYEQIAQRIGISVNTVKYHIKQALAMLRHELGPYLAFIAWAMMR